MRLSIERMVRVRQFDTAQLGETGLVSQYRELKAWVLLGDPGSGKTDTFKALATEGHYITARDFIELKPPPNGYTAPIFIDGLDEYTAATKEGMTAIGQIRKRLQQMGTPAFRLSCREADWRGSVDSDALQKLVGQENFAELHLQALTDADILAFAAHWLNADADAAQAFVTEAKHRGLDGLLTNPQTLKMLIEAVGNTSNPSEWPSNKQIIYEKACAKLVREQNENHLAAQRDTSFTDAQLLSAASYLCAVMLLSGHASIAYQRQKNPNPQALALVGLHLKGDCAPSIEACRAVLHTNLFVGNGNSDFMPIHRTVAEYLGAIYLNECLQAHLPLQRVLALIQSEDGGVVPELRGLHAWLAVVSAGSVRTSLIAHDALGLVLYGDVSDFSTLEKTHILTALQNEAKRYEHFRNQDWASRPFGALATVDMQDTFKAYLQSTQRTVEHLAVLDCVLDAMKYGHAMFELSAELEKVVADKTYWLRLRIRALETLCKYAKRRQSEACQDWAQTLERLLQAVHVGEIEDSENDLLGMLLSVLYPSVIRSEDLWGYYKTSSPHSVGDHWIFWNYLAQQYAARADIPALLDALLVSKIRLSSAPRGHELPTLIGNLLIEGITHFAQSEPVKRIYAWLTLSLDEYDHNGLEHGAQTQLRQWLETHTDTYKQLVVHGITQYEKSSQPSHMCLYRLDNLLCEAKPPSDAVDWYCALAQQHTGELRKTLLAQAFQLCQQREGPNAAIERMTQWAQQHTEDADWIRTGWLQCSYPSSEEHQKWIGAHVDRKKRQHQEQAEELAFLREELPKLTSDSPHIGLLRKIGQGYLGVLSTENNETPNKRLLNALHNDAHWVQLALAGLRHLLQTPSLIPTLPDILALNRQQQRYNIATACLAAMQLRWDEDASTAFDLPEPVIESLLAFRWLNDFGARPEWLAQLSEHKPELTSAVMLTLMTQQIKAKKEHIVGLYALAHDSSYSHIAQRIAPGLIDALPVRVAQKQLGTVRTLITCLLRTLARPQQLTLIVKRLDMPTLDVAQRVYWLTAGVQVAPDVYLDTLKTYLAGKQMRAAHAYDLLRSQREERQNIEGLTLAAKAFFIALLGPRFTPALEPKTREIYEVAPAMDSMRFVKQLIAAIAADPSDEARSNLKALRDTSTLNAWQADFKHALYEQQVVRRKANFQPVSAPEVCKTLANLQPANAADLHALVVDHLDHLAHEIRHGNTNNYRQYWNADAPKVENDCRNALLSDLKTHLKALGINAEPEGNYADQKRADIKVIYKALQMPVEIKRDSHKDLWTAIQGQLIAKYSRERSSDGHGVYIVFWFNKMPMPAAGDGGNTPKTPQELQARLSATIPKALAHKIAVLVIDCSLPIKT